ncbi:hypothetical protein [uncultured Tateyamaria sp.]|uniref:hypothetical protein n=1 Tax=uncultured Tateyamaria sp. TaxID=455651 RepID=UPI00261BBC30|nr:hypothetical protein [uncultured Tateyamaria sp.]
MFDWLEDPRYYSVTLWGATFFLGLVPFVTGAVLPIALWPVCFLAVKIVLSIWSGDILDVPQLGRLTLPTDKNSSTRGNQRPRGRKVIWVRLRLAAFAAFGASAFAPVVPLLLGIDLGTIGLMRFIALWFIIFLPLSIFSKWWLLTCLTPVRIMLALLQDAYVVWTGLTKTDNARDEALQRLYDVKNRLYVSVAGYASPYDFNSNPKSLAKDIPDFDE